MMVDKILEKIKSEEILTLMEAGVSDKAQTNLQGNNIQYSFCHVALY